MKDKLTVQIHGGKGGNKPSIDYSKKKKKKKKGNQSKIKRERNMRN